MVTFTNAIISCRSLSSRNMVVHHLHNLRRDQVSRFKLIHFMRLVWPCITFTFTSPSVSQRFLSGRCTFHALADGASIHSESKTWTWQFMFICKEGDIVIEVINSKRVHRWNGTAAGVAAAFSFMNFKGNLVIYTAVIYNGGWDDPVPFEWGSCPILVVTPGEDGKDGFL